MDKHTESSMTWLIVEDDASFRDIVTTMCELWGVNTIVFPDGRQAADWLKGTGANKKNEAPDLALLDIRIPGLQGHEVAAEIRRHPELSNIGIILMTAYELPGEEQQRIMAVSDADLLMFKPLPMMEELMKIARDIITKREKNATRPKKGKQGA